MIGFPGPCSALVTLPVSPGNSGIFKVLTLEALVLDRLQGVTETIPAFNRLLISGSAATWDPGRVKALLESLIPISLKTEHRPAPGAVIELPACYDPELAPDLIRVADRVGLSTDQVAEAHSSREYTVLATGFAPGFAYLGDLDSRIAVARHHEPRARVEAGSVGVADTRTGVYPSAGPGGWQLIGRVPRALFSDVSLRITRFSPGCAVRFRPLTMADYLAEGGA